jgi:hypothetical protein
MVFVDGGWVESLFVKASRRSIGRRFAARRRLDAVNARLVVFDGSHVVLIVKMRIFILLVETLLGHLRGLR